MRRCTDAALFQPALERVSGSFCHRATLLQGGLLIGSCLQGALQRRLLQRVLAVQRRLQCQRKASPSPQTYRVGTQLMCCSQRRSLVSEEMQGAQVWMS